MTENDDELLFIDDDEEEEPSELFRDDTVSSTPVPQNSGAVRQPSVNLDEKSSWKVLIVDDDEEIHFITKLALKDFKFDGKTLEFISAFSGEEAKKTIAEHPDTALVLLDVVMEDDEAGLKVVKHIRDIIKNQIVRIVLRTGQPGQAPENQVIIEYDINDYKTKTELTAQKLVSTIVTALRSFRDIIKRIEAQGALGEKAGQLQEERNIFISGPVCIFKWSMSEGLPVQYASPNVQEVLGYSFEEFIENQVSFYDIIHPEDLKRIKPKFEEHIHSGSSGIEQEYRITRKDGKVLWVNQYTRFVRDTEGKTTHFYGYIVDTTKKKETELLFFENAAEGIAIFNQDRTFSEANKAMGEMLGIDPKELTGRSIYEFLDEENQQVMMHMNRLLDEHDKGQRFEVVLKRPDGIEVPCMLNPTLLKDLSGAVTGMFAFIIDLTERRKMEDDLRRAMKAEKRFIATMSHEIRTPLTSILGFVELLRDTPLVDNQKELVQNVSISSQHLLSLINSILDVSKVEAGQLELTQEEMNLDEVLSECGIIVSNRVKQSVKLIVDIPELEYYVYGDQLRIRQLFVNLLGNATKFTDTGHIKLYINHISEEQDDCITFKIGIEDTGAGIPPDKQSALFKPFKQAHSSKYGGTGLGLYLSKSFANLMDGDITFESEEGKGTTFFVEMKLKKGGNKETKFNMRDRRILYVEDEAFLLNRMSEKFRSIEAEVITSTGDENILNIIDKVKNRPLDAMIIDVDYKREKSGYLAGVLKEMYPNLVTIGLKSESNILEFPEINTYITVPFTFYKLSAELNELFSRNESGRNYDFSTLDVLLVEDVEINQALAKKLFKKFFNIQIDTASDGIEAVEKARAHRYEVIFMDMNMPNMSGTEATVEIRKFDTTIPIVALTANAYAEDIEKAYASGMNGYVTKPFEKDKIQKALLNVLGDDSGSDEKPEKEEAAPISKPTIIMEEKSEGTSVVSDDTAVFVEDEGIDIKAMAYNKLIEEFGQEDADALIEELCIQAKRLMDETQNAIDSGENEKMIRGFHSIKGMLMQIDLTDQADIAKDLESMGRNDEPMDEILKKKEQLFHQLSAFSA